jgi:hypothetical protein
MTNDWETKGLERVADELGDDATFLSGWLPGRPDGRELVQRRLRLSAEDMNRLLLCRPPLPSRFRDDVESIAGYVHVDPVDLAEGLREAAALGALAEVLGATASVTEELDAMLAMETRAPAMAAARDAAAEPLALERPRARLEVLAHQFWTDAGQANGGRDLQRAVSVALPLAVTYLPRLGLQSVSSWLGSYGISYDPRERDRPLRGLLIATRGLGMVFIDGSLPDPDRRFTLAHEIGHFLLDYLEPRERALKEMPELTEVIDGEREPSRAERAKAMLQRVPIGAYTKLIERDPHGGAAAEIEYAEDEASLLAMELLAPWDDSIDVVTSASDTAQGYDESIGAATTALMSRFDLPADVARARAQACLAHIGRRRGLFDR